MAESSASGNAAKRKGLWQCIADDPQDFHRLPGAIRGCPPEKTLATLLPLLDDFGITRLADVTGLDRIGLPVYQAIRPNSRNISVSQGKGLTAALAKVSALMESIESFHAEQLCHPVLTSSVGEMRQALGYDPETLAVASTLDTFEKRALYEDPLAPPTGTPSWVTDDTVVDWIAAIRLSDGIATWVPKQLCELNFEIEERCCFPFFRATSNGLASGNTVTEALIHGLCEVIERDCLARFAHERRRNRAIALDMIQSENIAALLEKFAMAQLQVAVVDITGPSRVPCFEAFLKDREIGISRGAGCHLDGEIALSRALTEAAQGRLAKIAGSRDDLFREMYLPASTRRYEYLFALAPDESIADCPYSRFDNPSCALRDLVQRVETQTGTIPVAVDLRREHDIPVVFVLAPGLACQAPGRKGWVFLSPTPSGEVPVEKKPHKAQGVQLREGPATILRPRAPRAVIFFGPSISRSEVLAEFKDVPGELVCLPPVQQGDLLRLFYDPPDVIGVIDGLFLRTPSVLHKEILLLLRSGVRILGSASMGALRAAELDRFGMEGVGGVYRMYRDGLIDGDDEVAIVHGGPEEHFDPWTEPLVNVRHTIALATAAGAVTRETGDLVLHAARSVHFAERTWDAILNAPFLSGHPRACLDRLKRFVNANSVNLKHEDALLLVRKVVARLSNREPWPKRPAFKIRTSKYFYQHQRDYMGHTLAGHHVSAMSALSFYKLLSSSVKSLMRQLSRRLVLSENTRRQRIYNPPAHQLIAEFRARKRLIFEEDFNQWLKARGISGDELSRYLAERFLASQTLKACRRMHPHLRYAAVCQLAISALCKQMGIARDMVLTTRFVAPGIRSDHALLVELKMRNMYWSALEMAYQILADRRAHYGAGPNLTASGALGTEEWCARRWGVPLKAVGQEARLRGFLSYAELICTAQLACLHGQREALITSSSFALAAIGRVKAPMGAGNVSAHARR